MTPHRLLICKTGLMHACMVQISLYNLLNFLFMLFPRLLLLARLCQCFIDFIPNLKHLVYLPTQRLPWKQGYVFGGAEGFCKVAYKSRGVCC